MRIRVIEKHNMSEGILDTLKAATTWGSGETWGQAKSRTQTDTALKNLLKKAMPAWDNYAKRLKSMTPDPARYKQLYQQSLSAFVQKNLLGNQPIDSAINKREITQLIADITAAEDNPQQVASLFGQLTKQAAMSQQDTTRNMSMVKIISQNPMVVQFRNKTYILSSTPGQEGEWTDQATGKTLDPTWQAYLDNQTGLNQA
jgi:hypothetical protein